MEMPPSTCPSPFAYQTPERLRSQKIPTPQLVCTARDSPGLPTPQPRVVRTPELASPGGYGYEVVHKKIVYE